MKPLSRRALLRGAAGLAIGLPFLDAMLPTGRTARADDKKPPRRLILIHTPDGFLMERWTCPITGTSASLTDPKFPISDTIKAFSPILSDCLFLEGVQNSSALDSRSPAQGHPGGTTSMFTGAWAGPGNQYAGGPDKTAGPPEYISIDHAISNGLGQVTRFPALYAGVRVLDNSIARRPFYGESQAILAPEQDPHKVFSTVFGGLDPSQLAALKEQGTERQFVLDSMKGDYQSLRCKLGSADRQRLDGHITQIDELAGRLKLIGGGMSCAVPPTVPASLDPNDFDSAPTLTTTMLDMVAMAFACDLTRVVGFQLHASDADGGGVYSWLDHPTDFHDISHREGDDPEDKIAQADAWRAAQIVHLVQTLKSLKEADGSTVFDNTTILWTSEIGNGSSHDYHLPAWNIIGSGQGYFKTGRYLKFAGDQTTRHNLLLLHYLKMFGLDTSKGFGHPDYAKGTPLPGLTG
jgi:hypothetical protein